MNLNTALEYLSDVSQFIQGGLTYRFRVRALNVHGWSDTYSPVLLVLASDRPAKPDPITTQINNNFVRVAWTSQINNNYEVITQFQLLVKSASGTMIENVANCDGSRTEIVNQRFCDIPMIVLTSAPYSIPAGTLIQAQVRAMNKIGWSDYSDLNAAGVVAQTKPS